MNTIDHGMWTAYTPVTLPEGAPANALFARRDSDGADWYDYVNAGTNFNPAYVKIAAYWRDEPNAYMVGPATYDATAIFPAGCIVHEITDYAGSDPQGDLGWKAFDPVTGEFTDPVYPPSQGMAALLDRIAVLEAKIGTP